MEKNSKYIVVQNFPVKGQNGTEMIIAQSNHYRFKKDDRFDYGFMGIASREGYIITVLPLESVVSEEKLKKDRVKIINLIEFEKVLEDGFVVTGHRVNPEKSNLEYKLVNGELYWNVENNKEIDFTRSVNGFGITFNDSERFEKFTYEPEGNKGDTVSGSA